MKAVAFNGSSRAEGNTNLLIKRVFAVLKQEGVETETVSLAGEVLSGCVGCYKCMEAKNGKCAIASDKMNSYIDKIRHADVVLLGSPTYFADVSANMKALIERAGMVARANNNFYKHKIGASVVAVRRAGAIHAFETLNNFYLISEMIIVGSSYWNIGSGRTPGQVLEDEEGMKTMDTLGQNIVWLLKKIQK
ncbi:MAG: flavodoxin family protein [Candidatus Margulisbacteria bacterium]|nr:flavodoxin family protein [Candidatus Margulisiibacteriota bacterium]